MPRPRPRTRGTGNLRTPAVVLGFCDALHHLLQLKSGMSSTSLLWIRIKSGPPLYSSLSLPKHRNLGLDDAVTEALGRGRTELFKFLGEYISVVGETFGKTI